MAGQDLIDASPATLAPARLGGFSIPARLEPLRLPLLLADDGTIRVADLLP